MAEFETPTDEPKSKKAKKSTKKEKVFEKRKIAIKFSYEGTNYNGYQRSPLANGLATVEDHLFNAMLKERGYDYNIHRLFILISLDLVFVQSSRP